MSTRCNIIVKKGSDKQYVYHHCDGYINGVGKELKDFLKTVYKPDFYIIDELILQLALWDNSYKPCDSIHGDIEYLYTVEIDEDKKSVKVSVEVLADWRNNIWTDINSYEEIIFVSKSENKRYDHELKIDPEYFEAVKSGDKTFEVRSTKDRTFRVGDVVKLCEWKKNPNYIPGTLSIYEYPTGREIVVKITYILNNSEYCKEDYCVFSFVKI